MSTFIKHISKLIPIAKRKRLPFFFSISMINSLLDFVSIAFLTPFILLIINREKVNEFLITNFNIHYTDKHVILALIGLLFFYLLKNILQAKIVFHQSKYLYSIGSTLSKNLVTDFIYGSYENFYLNDKGKLIRDFHKLPIIFVTNILLPIYHLFSETVVLILIFFAGIFLNPVATLFAMGFVLLGVVFLLIFRKNKTKRFNEVIASSYREALNSLMNVLNGFIEIKGSKSENDFIDNFHYSNEKNNETLAELHTFRQNNIRYLEVMMISFIACAIAFILWNSESFKDMVLLSFYGSAIIKIIPSFNKIINAYVDIKSNRHAVDILTSYEPKKSSFGYTTPFEKEMQLEEVLFHYNNKNIIIENATMSIEKGELIAITGASGCGKTTLLYIISGLLSPVSGNVFIDGRVKPADTFLSSAYTVSQHPFIFEGTVLENIVMDNDGSIDYELIHTLLEAFDLSDLINTLPKGLNSLLHLDSKTISGGQKQRIALMRALYTKPKILILDEATNQLNSVLENKIFEYLRGKAILNELTVISVFHNQSLLHFATQHYEFEKGKLVKK